MNSNLIDKYKGCLVGLAVGDAVGTTLEFEPKGSFTPITDMVGGGPFRLRPGEWTDDTSMALCIAQSLIHCGKFDAENIMNRFCNWSNHGYMSSNGRCFDIGNTVADALIKFERTGEPFAGATHYRSAGNGCIMRIAPIPIFYRNNVDQALHFASESSRTTHGAAECVDSSKLFVSMILSAFESQNKLEILTNNKYEPFESKVKEIHSASFLEESYEDLNADGYVIRSLTAALWCFYHSNSFEEAILKSANLGSDADTTAAICGQLAGAYYGLSGIPNHWLEKLVMRDEIESMVVSLVEQSSTI